MSENSYNKFSKEVVIIGIMNILVALSEFILLRVVTFNLGEDGYGILSQVYATMNIIIPLASLGLPFAMVRFLSAEKDRRKIQEGFYSVVAIVALNDIIISLILIIFPELLADRFFGGASDIVRITGFITLAFGLSGVYLSFFRTFRRIKTYAIINAIRTYTETGLIAGIVLGGYGIVNAIWALLAVKIVLFISVFFLITSKIGIKRPRFSRIGEYLKFSLPTTVGNITAWVVTLSDRFVIASFLGIGSVGIYSAGYVMANSSVMFIGILGFLLPASLSQLYDEGRTDELKKHLRYSLKYTLSLAIPFVFGAAMLSEPVLRVFSPADMASQARWITPIVAVGFLFLGIVNIPGHILITTKKTKIIAAAFTVSALVNLALNILIVPKLGILGAAITTAIAYLVLLCIESYYAFKEIRFTVDWRFIIKSLLASSIMTAAVWGINPTTNTATILTVVLGIAIYVAALFSLRGFSREEIRLLRRLFKRGT